MSTTPEVTRTDDTADGNAPSVQTETTPKPEEISAAQPTESTSEENATKSPEPSSTVDPEPAAAPETTDTTEQSKPSEETTTECESEAKKEDTAETKTSENTAETNVSEEAEKTETKIEEQTPEKTEETPVEAEKADVVNCPIEDSDARAQPAEDNTASPDSIKDVDAAVDELLKDKELEARSKTPASDERSKDTDTTDAAPGASTENRSVEPTEQEGRGEDRSEGPKAEPEGRGDDEKGEEQACPESSLTDQTSQKEALQLLISEKTVLEKDFLSLKSQLDTLKIDYTKMEVEVETCNTSRKEQDTYIKSLEKDVDQLKQYEEWGKDNEQKVKDVQNKLTSLAEAEDNKNKMIADLEKQLSETKTKLDEATKNLEDGETSSKRADDDKPKSRTCVIM